MPPAARHTIRPLTADDAPAAEALYAASAVHPDAPVAILIQTGSAFLAAYNPSGALTGLVRHWDEDGIAWWDLLVSATPGAGRALARGVEARAQDRGLRLVRVSAPDGSRVIQLFHRWGYRTVAHTRATIDGQPATMAVLEKRLALLTVREQRRTDAEAIGDITGEDPWVYTQGARPGVFVASDGDRVVGFIAVRDAKTGVANLTAPALLPAYHGRGLELWMIERAATYAETNGFHTATVPATPALDACRRDLEDRHWFREADTYTRRFRDLSAALHDDD